MLEELVMYPKVLWREFQERRYTPATFQDIEKALQRAYRWKNPYAMCRRTLEEMGSKDPYAYGETWVRAADIVAKRLKFFKGMRLLEMGCGRGVASLYWNQQYACTVFGVDCVEDFVNIGNAIVKEFSLMNCYFVCDDLFSFPLNDFDVIYTYGSNFTELQVEGLTEHLEGLPKGARVVSISFPYESECLACIDEFELPFVWGQATAYVSVRV